jgi:hypothetical protein
MEGLIERRISAMFVSRSSDVCVRVPRTVMYWTVMSLSEAKVKVKVTLSQATKGPEGE